MSEEKIKDASAEYVTASKSKLSDLWKQEDWLAVWIGVIIIAVAAISVITGAFCDAKIKVDTKR